MLHFIDLCRLAYLDSELLASPSLEGGSPPLSTSESLESLTGREEGIGSMAGRERQATTTYVQFHHRPCAGLGLK